MTKTASSQYTVYDTRNDLNSFLMLAVDVDLLSDAAKRNCDHHHHHNDHHHQQQQQQQQQQQTEEEDNVTRTSSEASDRRLDSDC